MKATKPKAWIAWSSGKDSAWALHLARQAGEVEVVGMLATVTETYARVSMHGVREELLEAQAEAVGLPLVRVLIPAPCSNEVYEAAMGAALGKAKAQGVSHVIFGDLFLEDLRVYREKRMAEIGMTPLFPLWKMDTAALAREMLAAGLRAYLTCIDPRKLPEELAGHAFDLELLSKLPAGVDPCGENGEFHTFAWSGPMFKQPIPVRRGETLLREGFLFTDLFRPSNR
jgi:uncharacterized protein (TIGR00290 family)